MSTTEKKVTKTQKFDMLLEIEEVANNEMLVEFINHEKELIARKSKSGSKVLTAKQKENAEVIVPAIIEFLANNPQSTATEITEGIEPKVSVPRVSAQLRKLLIANKVTREMVKSKPLYSVA